LLPVLEVWSDEIEGRILNGNSIPDLVTEITSITGRMQPLPDWTQDGAVVGVEGGTEAVKSLANTLINSQFELPIAAFWIQDWGLFTEACL